MKTDELLHLCGELSDILRAFPGLELTEALAHVKQAVAEYRLRLEPPPSAPQQSPPSNAQPHPHPHPQPTFDLRELDALSSVELLRHLQTAKRFRLKQDLQSLAAQLGLSYAQRQTKSELIHMIVKSFELKRMDGMIRTESTEYKVEAAVT
jgi:hypothetical protein